MTPPIAFATYQKQPELTPDDRLVAEALRARGIPVVAAVWDDPAVDWRRFSCVVIRSTWDYHLKHDEFATWLRRRADDGSRVWNPPAAVLANLDKRYLCELASRGVDVVPTRWLAARHGQRLRDVLTDCGWADVVIKPAVSASAFGTWRTSLATAEADHARFEQASLTHDLLIQPYLDEIATQGEWSLVFFGGYYSHAVLKKPAPGDFRVQGELGGSAVGAEPSGNVIERARAILRASPWPLLYARVDGIEHEGGFMLMELEITEPYLFVGSSSGAATRFAAAIEEVVRAEQ